MQPGKTRLVMLESPTNPRMGICDIRANCDIAREVRGLGAAGSMLVAELYTTCLFSGQGLSDGTPARPAANACPDGSSAHVGIRRHVFSPLHPARCTALICICALRLAPGVRMFRPLLLSWLT